MTPEPVYAAVEAVWGRPALDPCWHWSSPVLAHGALMPREAWSRVPIRLISTPLLWYGWDPGNPPRLDQNTTPYTWKSYRRLFGGYVWLNPPYSDPAPWLSRLVEEQLPGVALLPVSTSTRWWNQYVWHPDVRTIGFFRKRLKFGRTDGGKQLGANFSSALVLYRGAEDYFRGKPLPDFSAVGGVRWVAL